MNNNDSRSIDFGDPKLTLFKYWDSSVNSYVYYTVEGITIPGAIVSPKQLQAIAKEMKKDNKKGFEKIRRNFITWWLNSFRQE